MSKIKNILKLINKEFGDNAAIIIDEDTKVKVNVIPTGIEVVDKAIGVGGIPRGRYTEVFGKEASGKTTLCLHAIASAHKMGLNCAFIDAEHSLSPDRMKELGVDTSKLVISQPNSGEEALNLIEMMVRSGEFGLIVVDSVAALVPQAEVDKDMGESVMGVHARLMSQAMRKLTAPVSKNNVALMFTNQTRVKIGGYVAGETTTGGTALKFYASLRLRLQFTGQIKDSSGKQISGKYRMSVVKNKLAVPFKEANFEINQTGIDDSIFLVEKLIEAGVLDQAGAFLRFKGEVVAQGKRVLARMLKEDPKLKAEMVKGLK